MVHVQERGVLGASRHAAEIILDRSSNLVYLVYLMAKTAERAVMVTTEFRGIFFGYMSEPPVDGSVTIKRARNCIYWAADVKGFLGLAANGPSMSCKIGPAVPSLTLTKVTSISEVTKEAVEKWENHVWQK